MEEEHIGAFGAILFIIGLIICVWTSVLIDSASDVAEEISSESIHAGAKVRLKGIVLDIPFKDPIFNSSIGVLEIDTYDNYFRSLPKMYVYYQSGEIQVGDTVVVEGYAYGYDEYVLIIGNSDIDIAYKVATQDYIPDTAKVQKTPLPAFWIGLIIIVIGVIIVLWYFEIFDFI